MFKIQFWLWHHQTWYAILFRELLSAELLQSAAKLARRTLAPSAQVGHFVVSALDTNILCYCHGVRARVSVCGVCVFWGVCVWVSGSSLLHVPCISVQYQIPSVVPLWVPLPSYPAHPADFTTLGGPSSFRLLLTHAAHLIRLGRVSILHCKYLYPT